MRYLYVLSVQLTPIVVINTIFIGSSRRLLANKTNCKVAVIAVNRREIIVAWNYGD